VKDIVSAVNKIRKYRPGVKVEVECDTIKQAGEALAAGADIIMLDNMGPETIKKAIRLIRGHKHPGKAVEIEISGGVNINTVEKLSKLGADRISVGALTHSAPSLDISLDIKNP